MHLRRSLRNGAGNRIYPANSTRMRHISEFWGTPHWMHRAGCDRLCFCNAKSLEYSLPQVCHLLPSLSLWSQCLLPGRKNQPFGNALTLDFYEDQCSQLFGINFTQSTVDGLLARYGGADLHPDSTTKIVYTYGLVDPYHPNGILSNISSWVQTIIIPDGSHCYEWDYPSADDPPDLVRARATITSLITRWNSRKQPQKM